MQSQKCSRGITSNAEQRQKSADLAQESYLAKVVTRIQNEIRKKYKGAELPHGTRLHIELVDDANDAKNKQCNYDTIQKGTLDLTNDTNWYCQGRAFALRIGTYKGHKTDLHITVCFFPDGCDPKLESELKTLVKKAL